MSYLNTQRLYFSGTFRADPSTLNNTPDNFNPNNQFPPNQGQEVSNNIQLYWNPNGTGVFGLDCLVTKVRYADGSTATTPQEDSLIGQSLYSLNNSNMLNCAKLVDLDPMQQNVTELWGLDIGIGPDETGNNNILTGAFKPAAYTNAWIQVEQGRGDYAGSAFYQSVLQLQPLNANTGNSRFLDSLNSADGSQPSLSIGFVLRSFNSSSHKYLVNPTTIALMNSNGIPETVTNKLQPLTLYNQGQYSSNSESNGLIPTTSYFQKLLLSMLGKEDYNTYNDSIIANTLQTYTPQTEFDFTYGQVFGSIGLHDTGEPDFLAPDRMLTPAVIDFTSPPNKVPTDSGSYNAYFAPCKVNQYTEADGTVTSWVSVNLGNSLPSTAPASQTNSYVDTIGLGKLQLCYFTDGQLKNPKLLGEIAYQDNAFYVKSAGIADVPISNTDVELIGKNPLGIVSVDESGNVKKIVLQENVQGYFMRANQFVYRMNPEKESQPNPGSVQVEFFASQYGNPVAGIDIEVSMMSSLDAATYSNNTLGTGGTSGMVNMSVPVSAVELEGKVNSPVTITTGADGKAVMSVKSLNPGNPRGYMDGQIYFLRYRFKDPLIAQGYIQSPDDLISLHVYEAQPAIEDVTWENFVQEVLGQYGKIYPVMSFLDLGNKEKVIANANKIRTILLSNIESGMYMPVTRDLSDSRLQLIVRWLDKFAPSK